MNRYDRYPGDYLRDTLTLTMAQDGAYTRLIDFYYSSELPIPVSDAMAAARCRNNDDEAVTQWVLARFFTLTALGYRHERIENEIQKARPRIVAAKLNGIKGGRPRKNPVGSSWVTQQEPSTEPSRNPDRNLPSPSPSIDQKQEHTPQASLTIRQDQSRGGRLPDDWQPTPELIEYARAKRPGMNIADQAEAFRDYWHAKAGAGARKVDWNLTFKTWIRSEYNQAAKPPQQNGGSRVAGKML